MDYQNMVNRMLEDRAMNEDYGDGLDYGGAVKGSKCIKKYVRGPKKGKCKQFSVAKVKKALTAIKKAAKKKVKKPKRICEAMYRAKKGEAGYRKCKKYATVGKGILMGGCNGCPYCGTNPVIQPMRTMGGSSNNPWMCHVAAFRRKHPDLSLVEALKAAKNSYNRMA